jgi:heme A synthase
MSNSSAQMTYSSSSYRLSGATVLWGLLVVVVGALVTGDAAATPPAAPGLAEALHPWLGGALGLLTLILAIRIVRSDACKKLRQLVVALVILALVPAGLAGSGAMARSNWIATEHAVLAQMCFAASVAVMVCASPRWADGSKLVEDYGWPSLRSLAISTPVILLLQVFLGAGLRHKTMGALSHIGFAMLAALWVLLECVFVIQQFPEHRALRPWANGLLAVTFTQVFLGIGAFTLRTMDVTGPALAAVTAAHVATGAITLAVSAALSIQIRRNVMPKGSLSVAA